MSLKGIRLSETIDYISKLDSATTEEDGATVFVLGSIDSNIAAHIADQTLKFSSESETGIQVSLARQNYLAVRYGLKGWRNLVDENGNVIEFKTVKVKVGGRDYQIVTDRCMDTLPPQIIGELGQKIQQMNRVSVEEAKNSDGE